MLYREFSSPSIPDIHQVKTITSTPPSQAKPPSSAQKVNHKVPPTHPKNLKIPKLGINANVYPMGLTSGGAIDAPKTAWDVGWYEKSALPGENGAMLIDGHVNDSFNTPGVFSQLQDLKSEDSLSVERGDGKLYTYTVISTEKQPVDHVDMSRLLHAATSKPALHLITCSGQYSTKSKTYSERVIVFAEQEE